MGKGERKNKMLIIGSFKEDYPRNKVLFSALKENFEVNIIKVEEGKYFSFLRNIFSYGPKHQSIFIVYPAQKYILILMLYRIFYSTRIIFDAFISFYDTYVFDKKLANKFSLKGLYYYLLDYLACRFSHILIFDTEAHCDYFKKTFNCNLQKKGIILPVSLDLELIDSIKADSSPYDKKGEVFKILFYGYYIPLQGVEYIIKAADILRGNKDIKFILIGSGQTYKEMKSLKEKLRLENIEFIARLDYPTLLRYIKKAHVCLGIFGNSDKAKRVIPNKVLDYLACSKIVITGNNSEMEKHFEDKKDIIYCDMASEKDLADKIMDVYDNYENHKKIGESGRIKVEKNFSKESLAKKIKESL